MNRGSAWLEGARMAPSAHNTQPWRFAPQTDCILVRWESERMLLAGDPTLRDLYLSLGAAIESACLASARAGVPLIFIPHPESDERTVGSLLPCDDALDPNDLLLAKSLETRHTARTAHSPRPVSSEVLLSLHEEARRGNCTLYVMVEREGIHRLARLARQATASQFADAAIHAELWQWLRLDAKAPAYRRDGLTADCLNLQGASLALARLTLPPTRMRWLRRVGLHHLLAFDSQWTIQRSASLCLLTAPSASRVDLLQTGRVLMRLWLMAAAAGLSTHPVSALLDCSTTVAPTVAVFGAEQETPASLFRLGATPAVARAPRLPAEELLEVSSEDERSGCTANHSEVRGGKTDE